MKPRVRMIPVLSLLLVALLAASPSPSSAAARLQGGVRVLRDVEYARAGGKPLLLDLYLPPSPGRPLPLVIWVPGSTWDDGDKGSNPPVFLTSRGFAVASISYRSTREAIFPAQHTVLVHNTRDPVIPFSQVQEFVKAFNDASTKRIEAWYRAAEEHPEVGKTPPPERQCAFTLGTDSGHVSWNNKAWIDITLQTLDRLKPPRK